MCACDFCSHYSLAVILLIFLLLLMLSVSNDILKITKLHFCPFTLSGTYTRARMHAFAEKSVDGFADANQRDKPFFFVIFFFFIFRFDMETCLNI